MAKWTKAMRAAAAEHGRRGGKLGNRAGKRRGGLVSWHTRTPEQQAAILERLRAAGGRQTNTSARARAAQGRRAKERWARREPMSAEQAVFLADIGVLARVPLAGAPPPGLPADLPRRDAYPDDGAYCVALNEWHSAKARARERAEREALLDGDEDGDEGGGA